MTFAVCSPLPPFPVINDRYAITYYRPSINGVMLFFDPLTMLFHPGAGGGGLFSQAQTQIVIN